MTLQVMFQKHLPKIIQLHEQPTDTRGKKSIKRCMGLLMGIFSGGEGGGERLIYRGRTYFRGAYIQWVYFPGFYDINKNSREISRLIFSNIWR